MFTVYLPWGDICVICLYPVIFSLLMIIQSVRFSGKYSPCKYPSLWPTVERLRPCLKPISINLSCTIKRYHCFCVLSSWYSHYLILIIIKNITIHSCRCARTRANHQLPHLLGATNTNVSASGTTSNQCHLPFKPSTNAHLVSLLILHLLKGFGNLYLVP